MAARVFTYPDSKDLSIVSIATRCGQRAAFNPMNTALQNELLAMLPSAKRQRADPTRLLNDLTRLVCMSDADLFVTTENCLKNVTRLVDTVSAEAQLQIVLIPELWERLLPHTGARLRKINTHLADWYGTPKDSFWRRMKSWTEEKDRLRVAEAEALRERIAAAREATPQMLLEQVRFAIAGARVAERFDIDAPVYDTALIYRVVPVLTQRVRARSLNNAAS